MTHLSRFVPRALALSALLLSPAAFSQESPAFIAPATWNTPFNGIAQVACHNCYEKQYASTFSSVLDSVRTLELDFWDQRDAVTGGSPRHWFVRHNPGTLFQSGNDNNCTGDGTGKNDLEACLNDVKNWSDNHPGHFPITVILDKKQGWSKESSGRTPKDFDELVSRVFQGKLYTPQDLATHIGSSAGALQGNLKGKSWPTASQLQGKVLLVLNHSENQKLSQYAEARASSAKVFIAPVTNGQNDVSGKVSGMSGQSSGYVAMNNMSKGDKKWAAQAFAYSHIGRVWGDDGVSFAQHISEKVNLSAYYKFAEQNAGGFRIRPF
ncbi:Ca2+-dependent phosphoinositide-specific phospholipase C [Pseudomonas protegens]|uniref:Ca2+-dependent phosphoinositide-specific phospholipase C n=1 Tax=Pseudomonas protegens TaxID=380021 RepID=UPI000642E442|nr:Ca2+-dependent phosphoinositide-specific phospholipase C [Pseudomonas protegens]